MNTRTALAPGEVIAQISAALDAADRDLGLLTDAALLEGVSDALTLAGRIQAYALMLLGEAESRDAAHHEHGLSTSTWLADTHRFTRREANRLLHDAEDLTRFTQVREGMLDGSISAPQSQAVTRVLNKLPDDLGFAAERAAESTMVEYCTEFDSHALTRLSRHLLDVVAPEIADETEARRLEREARHAAQRRHLSFTPDGDGSMLLRGSLPIVEGELLKAQVDAIASYARRTALDAASPLVRPDPATTDKRSTLDAAEPPTDSEPGTTGTRSTALDAADPLVRPEPVTMGMRRADALLELIDRASRAQIAPANGGDRPRIIVTINHDQLMADCTQAGLLPTGAELSAGELRRLACDADLLPLILGGPSGILDVGRDHRLVTPTIRAALTARDQGCVFPGCDQPPAACDAHHLIPWQQGGPTSLATSSSLAGTTTASSNPATDPNTPDGTSA